MDVRQDDTGNWWIIHAGREIDEVFSDKDEAWAWADAHIDDQFSDEPNWRSDPLIYREPSNA